MAPTGERSCEAGEEGRSWAPTVDESDGSLCYSDADDRSWHSPYGSNCANSVYGDHRFSSASSNDIDLESGALELCRNSSDLSSSHEIYLEMEVSKLKVNADKAERDCRICHLSLESTAPESGVAIELGCSCKDDLAAVHKHCAEKWFKIKGNKTCEVCRSTAQNVVVAGEAEAPEPWTETSSNTAHHTPPTETRSFWQGHRLLNFLLACMVFAIIISWLFHLNAPS